LKSWVVSANELAASAANLLTKRPPESFYKVNDMWRSIGDRQDSLHSDLQHLIESGKAQKTATGTKSEIGFQNTILIINA